MLTLFILHGDGRITREYSESALSAAVRDPTCTFWLDLSKPTDEEISLLLGQGTLQKIPKADIDIRQEVEVSSMPERLNESMSGVEFLDLMEFLAAQQTTPTTSAANQTTGGQ